MGSKFIQHLMFWKKDQSLLQKFEEVESKLLLSSEGDEGQVEDSTEPRKDKHAVEFLIEEEIFWKNGIESNNLNEDERESREDVTAFSLAIENFKSSELFKSISLKSTIKFDFRKDLKMQDHLFISWSTDYLQVIERKRINNEINNFISRHCKIYKIRLVHNHRRYNLSDKIGMKISLPSTKRNKHQQNTEYQMTA